MPLLIQAVDLVDTTIRIGNSSTSHRWGFTYAASASSRIAKKQDPSLGKEIVRVILGAKKYRCDGKCHGNISDYIGNCIGLVVPRALVRPPDVESYLHRHTDGIWRINAQMLGSHGLAIRFKLVDDFSTNRKVLLVSIELFCQRFIT